MHQGWREHEAQTRGTSRDAQTGMVTRNSDANTPSDQEWYGGGRRFESGRGLYESSANRRAFPFSVWRVVDALCALVGRGSDRMG
jgi:hypothetical protein